ncbi:MAG: hypothetical protein PVJ57_13930, partial [Phycisphaerae bacterium]
AYPGLRGSALYHADMNCDGYVNNFDIAPFIQKVSDPAAWYAAHPNWEHPDCAPPGDSEERAGGGATTPAAVAAMFEGSLSAGELSFVIEAATELAEYYGDSEEGAFWAAVAAALAD